MEHQKVLVLDFGGQYNQLIARRVREQGVYCDLVPYTKTIDEILDYAPIGIIFTGGPNSVYDDDAPDVDKRIFELGIPILGICYGCQLIAYKLGGDVTHADTREYGRSEITYGEGSKLFEGVTKQNICWMSHTDYVSRVPKVSASRRPRRPVPRRVLRTKNIKFTASSSIRKCITPTKAKRFCTTSCIPSARQRGTGRCPTLSRNRFPV